MKKILNITGLCIIYDLSDLWDDPLPLEVAKHLRVSEELAKVDVEHVTRVFDHDVIVVSVADPQQVGGDTVAGTGRREVLDGLRTYNTS